MSKLTKEYGVLGTKWGVRPKLWYDYMKWLAKKVNFDKKVYYNLVKNLHDTDFVWSDEVEMDKNRAGDGVYQRYYFFKDLGLSSDSDFSYPCSVFEMLVAFTVRMGNEYLGYTDSGDDGFDIIFSTFLVNLGLKPDMSADEIDEKLYIFMKREYKNDGIGSLFCLPKRINGYNKMEIWKQMNVFLMENKVENADDLERFL